MAEEKKSFMFYCDWQDTFKELPKDKGYDLLMHLLAYVNDENPETKDPFIKALFPQFKNQLKRDLEKYENRRKRNSVNGAKGGRPKTEKPKETQVKPKEPKKPTALVPVLMDSEKNIWLQKWLKYRIDLKKPIKVESTLKGLMNKIESEPIEVIREVISKSIDNQYTGLFWDNTTVSKTSKKPLKKNAGQILKDRLNEQLSNY